MIAVMGITGSGKSTFVSHFCPEARIGHGLESGEVPPGRIQGRRAGDRSNSRQNK